MSSTGRIGRAGLSRRGRVAAMFSVAVVATLAACGDSSSSSSPSSGGQTDANLATACQTNLTISEGFNQLFSSLPPGGPQGAPPSDATKQQTKALYAQLLAKPIADVAANPPSAIASEIKDVTNKIEGSLGATGDAGAIFSDSALQAKTRKIDLFFYDNCQYTKHEVGAVEYGYSNLPAQLSSGQITFKLTANGKEDHEILFATLKPGVTETFDQILSQGREQGQSKLSVLTNVSASPGKPDTTTVTLKPGKYIAFCTVSKGTVDGKDGGGPPHFTLGMKQEITVT